MSQAAGECDVCVCAFRRPLRRVLRPLARPQTVRGALSMGFLPPKGSVAPETFAPEAKDIAQAVEITMFSEGLTIRVGAAPDDVCRIEELSIGDPIWDLAAQRLVDVEAMGCATLDAAQLAELGLRPMALAHGAGWFALASARLIAPPPRLSTDLGPTVFFRIWPDSRVVAEVAGRPVLLRHGLA